MSFDLNLINPYIRVAMPSVLTKGTVIEPRIIFDYELIYVEDGQFTLVYNGISYKCTKGAFLLLRPGVTHSFHVNETDLYQPHIHFDITYSPKSVYIPVCYKDMPQLTPKERGLIQIDVFDKYPLTPFVSFSDKDYALRLFYAVTTKEPTNPLTRKARLIELISLLIADNFSKSIESEENHYDIARQLKDFLDTSRGYTVGLDELEKCFSYSKYHLERIFKKRFGVSIMSYRNKRRMEYAKELLLTNSVSETAKKLGFSSIYVFSRAFKQYYGISPTGINK